MRKPFVTNILKRVTPLIGAKLLLEPEYNFVGSVLFKNGKRTFYSNTGFSLNTIGAASIIKDKGYTKFFLNQFGYKTPKGKTFFSKKLNANLSVKRSIDDGYTYAISLGFPVILKPNTGSQGSMVTKVYNKKEYYSIARKILRKHSVLLVEKFCEGLSDYRVVVLDKKVISAYKRIPLSVIGDGKSSIKILLHKKKDEFEQNNRGADINLSDYRITENLKKQRLTLQSVLKKDMVVYLLDNANLSTGGVAIDYTKTIHNSYKKLAVSVTKDLGLRLCGVDILAKDITKPQKSYVILELNAAPGLDNYASIGKIQRDRVDKLYLEILKILEKEK